MADDLLGEGDAVVEVVGVVGFDDDEIAVTQVVALAEGSVLGRTNGDKESRRVSAGGEMDADVLKRSGVGLVVDAVDEPIEQFAVEVAVACQRGIDPVCVPHAIAHQKAVQAVAIHDPTGLETIDLDPHIAFAFGVLVPAFLFTDFQCAFFADGGVVEDGKKAWVQLGDKVIFTIRYVKKDPNLRLDLGVGFVVGRTRRSLLMG